MSIEASEDSRVPPAHTRTLLWLYSLLVVGLRMSE